MKPGHTLINQSSVTGTALTMNQSAVLAQNAYDIKRLGKRAVADIIEIGRLLKESKAICGHGNWLPWLEREFGWTKMTAARYINVFEMSKNNNLLLLDVPVSALYQLSAPSTPEPVRTEILDRAKSGEKLSHKDVKGAIDNSKPPKVGTAVLPKSANFADMAKSGQAKADVYEGTSTPQPKDNQVPLSVAKINEDDDEGCQSCRELNHIVGDLRKKVTDLGRSLEIAKMNARGNEAFSMENNALKSEVAKLKAQAYGSNKKLERYEQIEKFLRSIEQWNPMIEDFDTWMIEK